MPSPQMTTPILAALLDHPEGMTAKDLARVLNWTALKASRQLGLLFFAGDINRRSRPARTNNEFVYTIRAGRPAVAPPTQWVPLHEPGEQKPLPAWARQYAALADDLAEEEVV